MLDIISYQYMCWYLRPDNKSNELHSYKWVILVAQSGGSTEVMWSASQPIRDQCWGHVISMDQSEASVGTHQAAGQGGGRAAQGAVPHPHQVTGGAPQVGASLVWTCNKDAP